MAAGRVGSGSVPSSGSDRPTRVGEGRYGDAPRSSTTEPPAPRPVIRWIARVVTIGVLVIFGTAVFSTIEAWPVTSFRLFSATRTDRSTSLHLEAVEKDGTRRAVEPDVHHPFVVRTKAQFSRLSRIPEAERRAKALAWLDAAGIDPDDVTAVVVRRRSAVLDKRTGASRDEKWRDVLTIRLDR